MEIEKYLANHSMVLAELIMKRIAAPYGISYWPPNEKIKAIAFYVNSVITQIGYYLQKMRVIRVNGPFIDVL